MAFVEDRWEHHGNKSRRRWRARYRASDGREHSQSFSRKADARRFAAEREAAVQAGRWIDPRAGNMPLRTWAQRVMASRLHLRPATRARDVAYLNNHVLNTFGDRPLSHISKEEVQAWVQFLVEGKGLAPRTVRECYRVLASMMREAVDSKLLPESPCRRIALPRIPSTEKRFLSAMEVVRLADTIDPRFRAFVFAGCYLGLRWGELAGLKRANLDLGARRARVVGSLERVHSGFRYVEETKTAATRRTLSLPGFLVTILSEHLAIVADTEFVFPAPQRGCLNYHSWRTRFWNPAVKKASLWPFNPHEMRHTCVALLIDQGAHPLAIQRYIGHSDIRTTMNTYGHLFPNHDDASAHALDAAFGARVAAPTRPRASSDIIEAMDRQEGKVLWPGTLDHHEGG
jgi:integrase